jgi:hypothetical protein
MGKRNAAALGISPGLLVRQLGHAVVGKPAKYSAERCTSEGRSFASRAEAQRYRDLLLAEKAGSISGLTCQPSWTFIINGSYLMIGKRKAKYTADFSYVDKDGVSIVEDVKGFMTRDASLRIALMLSVHRISVRIIR